MKQYEYVELKYEAKDVLFFIDAKGCLRKIDLIFEKEN
mgnify:CR=1 FL=1